MAPCTLLLLLLLLLLLGAAEGLLLLLLLLAGFARKGSEQCMRQRDLALDPWMADERPSVGGHRREPLPQIIERQGALHVQPSMHGNA